jgi:hypothetical protein
MVSHAVPRSRVLSVRPLYVVLPSRSELLSDLLPAVRFVPFSGKIGVE